LYLYSFQFFERGAHAATSTEDKQRLESQFGNSNAIGSDAYFGREPANNNDGGGGGGGDGGGDDSSDDEDTVDCEIRCK
jgi:hypothetical protein